jgi:hypothetical protein
MPAMPWFCHTRLFGLMPVRDIKRLGLTGQKMLPVFTARREDLSDKSSLLYFIANDFKGIRV